MSARGKQGGNIGPLAEELDVLLNAEGPSLFL